MQHGAGAPVQPVDGSSSLQASLTQAVVQLHTLQAGQGLGWRGVEVEVDDETGEVTVTDMKSAYEVGRALNPRLVEQQLRGGAWMGSKTVFMRGRGTPPPSLMQRTAPEKNLPPF
jgi:CO/xanthine dehydrogenase Mo-binding subunit